jgi:hypothetical protein
MFIMAAQSAASFHGQHEEGFVVLLQNCPSGNTYTPRHWRTLKELMKLHW